MATFPTDLAHDLALDSLEIRKLYRELGCRIEKPKTDEEAARWGIKIKARSKVKDEEGNEEDGKAKNRQKDNEIAVLRVPLRFPALGKGRRAR